LSFFSIAKESKALAAEEIELEKIKAKETNTDPTSSSATAIEPSFTGDMRNRKGWWGKRTIRIHKKRKAEAPRSAPGGGAITGGRATGPGGDKSPMRSSLPAADEWASEYDDEDSEEHAGLSHSERKERPRWAKAIWEDLKVGDFVRLKGDDSVPAGKSIQSSGVAWKRRGR
jgi:hypothetical protein